MNISGRAIATLLSSPSSTSVCQLNVYKRVFHFTNFTFLCVENRMRWTVSKLPDINREYLLFLQKERRKRVIGILLPSNMHGSCVRERAPHKCVALLFANKNFKFSSKIFYCLISSRRESALAPHVCRSTNNNNNKSWNLCPFMFVCVQRKCPSRFCLTLAFDIRQLWKQKRQSTELHTKYGKFDSFGIFFRAIKRTVVVHLYMLSTLIMKAVCYLLW